MADSGTYYIAYKRFGRDCCIFEDPINNRLFYSLEDVLEAIEDFKKRGSICQDT
jgi:hypothetical protein